MRVSRLKKTIWQKSQAKICANALYGSYHFAATMGPLPEAFCTCRRDRSKLKLLRMSCRVTLFHLSITALFLPSYELKRMLALINWSTINTISWSPGLRIIPWHTFMPCDLLPKLSRLILEVSSTSLSQSVPRLQRSRWLKTTTDLEAQQLAHYWLNRETRTRRSVSVFCFDALRLFIEKVYETKAHWRLPNLQNCFWCEVSMRRRFISSVASSLKDFDFLVS